MNQKPKEISDEDCELSAWDTEHGIAIVLSSPAPFITDQDYLI